MLHTGTSVIDRRPVEEPWQATEKGFLDRENTHTHTHAASSSTFYGDATLAATTKSTQAEPAAASGRVLFRVVRTG